LVKEFVMKDMAVVEDLSNLVTNIVVVDDSGNWNPGDGFSLVDMPEGFTVSIGCIYNPVNHEFTFPGENRNA